MSALGQKRTSLRHNYSSLRIRAGAYVAIRGRRHCVRGVSINDVSLIVLDEIQERLLSRVLARCFFSFDVTTNGVDRLPERIFSGGSPHVYEFGGCRVLHFPCDCDF
jgi:hypothetical protein